MDSTYIELPNKFMNIYVGKGGGASKAAAKFNVEYDLITGEFKNVGFFSGTKSDSDCMHDVIYDVEAKDLCIKDLGYFNLKIFKNLDEKEAFYISKIKSNTGVYSDDLAYQKFYYHKYRKDGLRQIDISKVTESLCEGQTVELDNIYIGATHKLKTRLIVTKLSEEIKEKRKKLREKNAKKKKLKSSNSSLDGANVYITNISKENMTTNEIYNLYRLRWQIEIMFKIWKSIFNINKVNNVKLERFECFVYSKLIYILLSSTIINISNLNDNKKKNDYTII